MKLIQLLLSNQRFWTLVQQVLGSPTFKQNLYRSKLQPPGRLLDFGCANGHLAEAFAEFEYYGVDLDPRAIEDAKQKHLGRPGMHFLAADLRTRPFPPDYFDEILFACTVHHLDDDALKTLLTELHYCLRPGGTIHLFDPVRQEKDGWSQKLIRRFDQGKYSRTIPEIFTCVESLGIFECGETSLHVPYGALLRDCDVLYLPLGKRSP